MAAGEKNLSAGRAARRGEEAKSHTSARNGIRSRRAERHILEMCRLCCSQRLTAYRASWKYYETLFPRTSPIDRHLPSTNPLTSFVSNLTQKSPGFTATKITRELREFQIYQELTDNRSNRDREYCGEYREIPFNFIRGFSRDMVKPRIPLGEGISFQGLSVRG